MMWAGLSHHGCPPHQSHEDLVACESPWCVWPWGHFSRRISWAIAFYWKDFGEKCEALSVKSVGMWVLIPTALSITIVTSTSSSGWGWTRTAGSLQCWPCPAYSPRSPWPSPIADTLRRCLQHCGSRVITSHNNVQFSLLMVVTLHVLRFWAVLPVGQCINDPP